MLRDDTPSFDQQRILLAIANDSEKPKLEHLLRRFQGIILQEFDMIAGTSGSVRIAEQVFGSRIQYKDLGHGPGPGDARAQSFIHTQIESSNPVFVALVLLSPLIENHQRKKEALLWTIVECECVWLSTATTASAYFEMREAQTRSLVVNSLQQPSTYV